MHPNDVNRDSKLAGFSTLISIAVPVVSVLQGVYFATEGARTIYDLAGVVLAVANLSFGVAYLASGRTRLLGWTLAFYAVQFGMFAGNLAKAPSPPPLRLLQVAIAVSYLGAGLAAVLLTIPILGRAQAILLAFLLAAGLFTAEAVTDAPPPPPKSLTIPSQLIRNMLPDPRLGGINPPNSTMTAYYQGNSKGSFHDQDLRESQWWLHTGGGSVARLILPSAHPDDIRIDITRAATSTAFDIQLNHPGLRSVKNSSYAISFRARSDRPRSVFSGFARAHGSFDGLGYYSKIALTSEWRNIEETFVASADDDNARVFFDVGDNEVPVEVSAVRLRLLPEGMPVEPDVESQRYAVDYRFNALGCRGPDYPSPKAGGSTRLLFLGNSYTLGEGISEDAVVSWQLEHLLNAGRETAAARENYEVINCGASGYGTREERLFYELSGAKYQPDIVVIGMTWNDRKSFWDRRREGDLDEKPGKAASLFTTWARIEEYRSRRYSPDFSRCVEEVLQLDREVRQHGARLIVFIFRNNADYSGSTDGGALWNQLSTVVNRGLQGTGIRVLDLGLALEKQSSAQDLTAHSVIGFQPNEAAHAIAAQELFSFLQREDIAR